MPADDPSTEPRRKRAKIVSACTECRRKKTKCNGEQPCRNCERSKAECVYPSTHQDDRRSAHNRAALEAIEERLKAIEDMLRIILPTLQAHGDLSSSAVMTGPGILREPSPSPTVSTSPQSTPQPSHDLRLPPIRSLSPSHSDRLPRSLNFSHPQQPQPSQAPHLHHHHHNHNHHLHQQPPHHMYPGRPEESGVMRHNVDRSV